MQPCGQIKITQHCEQKKTHTTSWAETNKAILGAKKNYATSGTKQKITQHLKPQKKSCNLFGQKTKKSEKRRIEVK